MFSLPSARSTGQTAARRRALELKLEPALALKAAQFG
jgi:hypothetical protein